MYFQSHHHGGEQTEVDHTSEKHQVQNMIFNPLSPHDALKHHFTSLKTDLIFLQPRVAEWIFYETGLPIYMTIFTFSLTLCHFHPLQVENCDSNSRLAVDEDDNGKVRLERVQWSKLPVVGPALAECCMCWCCYKRAHQQPVPENSDLQSSQAAYKHIVSHFYSKFIE